ncbi:hypothetical protein DFP72DRAFT_886880 [Ephemerocybe angulata]|uniref:Uncharacterized protein n=1 Tax=Ephemerocybe angulata TaxID=980116 RepID=A0A8H6M8I8_9AGAR|nr:hypothetical protein DFP72DRAFT_886880 [Tulosesus angulatus]
MTPPANHLTEQEVRDRLWAWASRTNSYPLCKGSSEGLWKWFMTVERICRESNIVETQRTEAAILLLLDSDEYPLQGVMRTRQQAYLEKCDVGFWSWALFKKELIVVIKEAEKAGWSWQKATAKAVRTVQDWLIDHAATMTWKKVAGIALLTAGGCVLGVTTGILLLNWLGFTLGGVAAGSFATWIQSVFYGPATGGVFSVLQMLGATLALPSIELVVLGGGAAPLGRRLIRG